nr:hypothetical protein [Tanacetum cinerariifolium]
MANENVPAPASTRSDDQIPPFAARLDEDWFRLDVNLLKEALEITLVDQAHPFVSPPSAKKEGSKKKMTPKADKPVKPAPAKQAKPATTKQPKPKLIKEKSTKPTPYKRSTRDDTSSNIVRKTPSPTDAETGADTDKVISAGDIEILNISEVQGEDVDNKVYLEEQTVKLDEGQAGSDPSKTLESKPPPNDDKMDEDQAGSDHGKAIAGSNPEPLYDDFVANVYPKVRESLKFLADEQVILEDPLSSSETLSSMKTLDDTYIFGDQLKQPPALQSSAWKMSDTREAPFSSSKQHFAPHSKQPVEDVDALAMSYKDLEENKLLSKTGDMRSFIKWFCKKIGKKKLSKFDLEGPAFKVVKAFHENSISLQFQMKECHRLLTDQVDLVNPKGRRLVPDVSEPLPLGARTTALSISKLKAANYPDFRLEELVPSLWIESKRDYNISEAYGITHWWFKRREFYITRQSTPSDHHAVRSHMRILSVISIKTFERYGYAYLREIDIRKADYNEYKIPEAGFKNLHSNDFKDLYLLHLQGKLNHLPESDKVHLYNVINLWIRNIVIRQRMGDL